ncbi:hypothetical protein [Kushneria phosphatilytica]|uniref:hypothetical protein n=1 Tax=Kushneria phosphatilytica TaxID=657387 RepID=UPI001439DA41|nr:hypothetical protein [Kushneria phosphatilytica]
MSHEYEYLGQPINKTAARVLSPGEAYTPQTRALMPRWKMPPQTRVVPSGMPNLTGMKRGRMTVIGLLADESKKAKWVVRCVCGWYETRSSKAIRNPKNMQERCQECRHLAYLQRNETWRRTGKNMDHQ